MNKDGKMSEDAAKRTLFDEEFRIQQSIRLYQASRPLRMMPANRQRSHARGRAGLVLAIIGLISATGLVTDPIRLASAETVIGSWSVTGSLNQARSLHTATLLLDGKVLVTGGSSSTPGAPANAELYDPSTGTWSTTGSPNKSRYLHTATLLPDGKVLVTGGFGETGAAVSAELYDPSTGTWSHTGSLNVPRDGHTATLLANGRVLVAGDISSDLRNASAELYDPATGEWSFTENLNVARRAHTATLLANGKVLFAGGGTNTAELYDPATGKWSLTGKLSETRVGHKATLLQDGKVLVAGGCMDWECFFTLRSAELYDPNTETWSITGSFNTPRFSHTLTLLTNGNVVLSGSEGQCCPFITLDTAELYNPTTGRWSFTGSLNRPRAQHTATLLPDGKVLIAGGTDNTAELYDPEALGTAPTVPRIIMGSVSGKRLIITGENFEAGAVILINGQEQKTKRDDQNPQTTLIGKKAGKKKKIRAGDKIQVRSPNGTTSEEFTFTGS